jgi:type I restriction enzyme S subunit
MQGQYPYWGANCVLDHVDKWLFDEDLVLLGEDGAPFFDRTKDVAFFVSGRIWVNNHAHVLKPYENVDPRFMAKSLNVVDYKAFTNGSTRDKLTQSEMNTIPIPCPSILEQRSIATFLDNETTRIDSLISMIRESIEKSKQYRVSMISSAVTGKIDVRQEVA